MTTRETSLSGNGRTTTVRLVLWTVLLQDVEREWSVRQLAQKTAYHLTTVRFQLHAMHALGQLDVRSVGVNDAGHPLKLWFRLARQGVEEARAVSIHG